MRRCIPVLLLILALAAAQAVCARTAGALESAPATSKHSTATLVTDTDAWQAGTPFRVALRLRLPPGWHTYWLNPGAAGAAPELTLTLPRGGKAGPIEWPAPHRIPEGPLMAYGYTGDVLLPVTITPPAVTSDLPIRAHANWLVCAQLCVPEQADFTLDLPTGKPAPSPEAPLFAAAAGRFPVDVGLSARIASDGTFTVTGAALDQVADAVFFPEKPGALDDAAAQTLAMKADRLSLTLKPGDDFPKNAPLAGVLAVTSPGGTQHFYQVNATPGGPPAQNATPLARMLIFAFLGGLILNLMPCVFPILAIKAVALAGLSGGERRRVRAEAVSYVAGVLVAFATLATVLLILRGAGSAAGWGFQFQSPIFVAVMAWLLFGVGLNLSGVFELGVGSAGAGQGLAVRAGHAGSFFTGLLAVLVATPCTAPFMGVAIAAALAAPAPVALAVFLALGLGLAAPYVVLALVPRLAGLLPRPGRWMLMLKQALAFPMYGAAAWLLWVASQESGPSGVLATVTGFVLLGFGAWAYGAAQRSGRGRVGRIAALAAALAAFAALPGLATAPPMTAAVEGETFTPDRLAALRSAGRPVFVNVTAAWCITCLVNERLALSPPAVQAAFAAHNVAYLRGDWTRQDPAISDFLRRQGRDGVPLYVFYPPNGEPVVLPQILTAGTVLHAIG